jgi:hypothetical protein
MTNVLFRALASFGVDVGSDYFGSDFPGTSLRCLKAWTGNGSKQQHVIMREAFKQHAAFCKTLHEPAISADEWLRHQILSA